MPSNEMFYTAKDGSRADEDIHSDILGSDDKSSLVLSSSIDRMRGAVPDEILERISKFVKSSWN